MIITWVTWNAGIDYFSTVESQIDLDSFCHYDRDGLVLRLSFLAVIKKSVFFNGSFVPEI